MDSGTGADGVAIIVDWKLGGGRKSEQGHGEWSRRVDPRLPASSADPLRRPPLLCRFGPLHPPPRRCGFLPPHRCRSNFLPMVHHWKKIALAWMQRTVPSTNMTPSRLVSCINYVVYVAMREKLRRLRCRPRMPWIASGSAIRWKRWTRWMSSPGLGESAVSRPLYGTTQQWGGPLIGGIRE